MSKKGRALLRKTLINREESDSTGSSRKEELYKSLIKKEEFCLLKRNSSILAGGSISTMETTILQ